MSCVFLVVLKFVVTRSSFYFCTYRFRRYGYMASDIIRTILIMRKETPCRHMGYSFRLAARVLLYAPSHRQDSTYHGLCYTSRGALAGTRNSSMGRRYGITERSIPNKGGVRCSSVVRAFAHGAMDRRIDPSWWTHWAIFRSSQCSTTGVTKVVIYVILSVGWCI